MMSMKNKNKPYQTYVLRSVDVSIEETEGKRYIAGIIPYNVESDTLSANGYNFREVIAPTAFVKSIAESDIKCLVNHDTDKVLGSSRNGTLELDNREDGLYFRVLLGNQSYALDAYESISRGDVRGVSFGFAPIKTEDKGQVSILREVRLFEISPACTFPAYPDSDSVAFKRDMLEAIKVSRSIDIESLSAILAKPELDQSDRQTIYDVGAQLQSLADIPVEERKEEAVSPEPPSALSAETLAVFQSLIAEVVGIVTKEK